MAFRFNFSNSLNTESEETVETISSSDKYILTNYTNIGMKKSDFLRLENINFENTNEDISLLQIGDLEIKYILVKSVQMKTENETFSQVDALNTDIIPGKYEGGLKIWECSLDLAIYLVENHCIKKGQDVLELGCGAGIPGIVAYLSGAKVTFQDFNSEVLKFVTVPNTVLNSSQDQLSSLSDVCQYLHGDWGCIMEQYYAETNFGRQYDIIVTSETIYDKLNSKKLLLLMKAALKPDGVIYLAAKIHYFGVGGGITDFEMLVKQDETFEISPVLRITDGVERQILKMTFRKF